MGLACGQFIDYIGGYEGFKLELGSEVTETIIRTNHMIPELKFPAGVWVVRHGFGLLRKQCMEGSSRDYRR